jgi:hypothetical protein
MRIKLKNLLAVSIFCFAAQLKCQDVVLTLDSFYRYEFKDQKEFESFSSKGKIKRQTKWEYGKVIFISYHEDSSIYFIKESQEFKEFPQTIDEIVGFKPMLRTSKSVHRYYYVHDLCGVESLFVDLPSGRKSRILIYYHLNQNSKYEGIYFPYDPEKMADLPHATMEMLYDVD